MPTITIPDSVTINLAQKGGTFVCNISRLDGATIVRALTHGLQQKINDTMAGGLRDGYVTASAQATAVFSGLCTNGWAARAAGTRTTDPIAAFVRREATATATARCKKDYGKVVPADVARIRDAYLAHEGWVEKTRARYVPLDDDFDIDLGDEPLVVTAEPEMEPA